MNKNTLLKLTLAAFATGVTAYLAVEGTRRVRKATAKNGGVRATLKSWFDFTYDTEEACVEDFDEDKEEACESVEAPRPAFTMGGVVGCAVGESLSPGTDDIQSLRQGHLGAEEDV